MRAPRPRVVVAPRGKSALTRIRRRTTARIKVAITDNFDNLDNWVQLSGTPTITSGRLTGSGAVRHRDRPGSDDFRITAVVGAKNNGTTRIITCASDSFDRFYGLDIFVNGGTVQFSVIKGTSVVASTSLGLFGILLGLLGFFLGSFSSAATIPKYATVSTSLNVNDNVGVWWDEDDSVIRIYKNGSQITSLEVDPWEIPHGEDYRYWGVMQGVNSTTGVQFTTIEAADA